jgi:sugar phosphate isomerase/epimerase
MMMKTISLLLGVLFCVHTHAQNSDDQYKEPLKKVLTDIEKRFVVKITYSEDLVKDRWVTYAGWRFRPDLEKTLDNVLSSQDISFSKTNEKQYKLNNFSYHLKTPEEGQQQLDYLSTLYHDAAGFEKRKIELRECMWQSLRLSPLPAMPSSKPIIVNKRKMDGYTIENIGFEILPGLYIAGSLYKPAVIKGKIPVILCPDGHWEKHRYRPDCQYRCATLARMGVMAISYDLFAWGESLLQFKTEDHRRSLAMTIQALSSIRILDYLLSLKEADTSRVAISGGSGGGSQTMLITALDDRIKLSAPIVMLSSYHSGGCPCESGMPVHLCGGGTNNPEIASMAAPRPQLIVSDGKDWTANVPNIEFPFLKKIYGYYGAEQQVQNVHIPDEGHDFGISKRTPLYEFIAKHFKLDINKLKDVAGKIDESKVTIEKEAALYVFGEHGENLPANAIKGFEILQQVFEKSINDTRSSARYKVAVVDVMILKRQKLGAIPLTKEIGADGVEIDMGSLGSRETFENQLAVDSIRDQFLNKAKELEIEIPSLGMTGFYAQSFPTRSTYQQMVGDCINTMKQMNVKVAFLPLGVQGDLVKHPELRPAIVERLKVIGKMAQDAGVVIGIETALNATDEVKLLKDIGSPAIQVYFNFSNPLKEGRDLYKELRILGKDRICMIHCTNKDSVWLQNDPQIDMKKAKQTLDEMGWHGWLVIERSRDARDGRNVKRNFGANAAYVKRIFQSDN